jgi:hypothetical protein
MSSLLAASRERLRASSRVDPTAMTAPKRAPECDREGIFWRATRLIRANLTPGTANAAAGSLTASITAFDEGKSSSVRNSTDSAALVGWESQAESGDGCPIAVKMLNSIMSTPLEWSATSYICPPGMRTAISSTFGPVDVFNTCGYAMPFRSPTELVRQPPRLL